MDAFTIPFCPEHVGELNLSPDFPFEGRNLEFYLKGGPAVTLVVDGRKIGCGGVAFPWNGMGEAWACFDVDIARYPLSAVKLSRRFLNDVFVSCDMRRMQAMVRADAPRHCRFVEHLGFSFEGLLRAFDEDGHDYMMYARIRE
jgi:hypothetical protein